MFISILLPLIGTGLGLWILPKESKKKLSETVFLLIAMVGTIVYLKMPWPQVLFFSIFMANVVTDTHEGLVYDFPLYLMAPVSLYLFYENHSYISGIFMILIPIYRKSKKLQFYFGEGDLWILLFISMAFGRDVFFTLFYASCIGIVASFAMKKKEIYFVPFLFIGLILAQYNPLNALMM